jgi:allantoinase
MEAWGGIASLQLGLASVWTEARRRGYSLEQVLRWMGHGPRRLLGWPEGLKPGVAADLVAFDPEGDFLVEPATLQQRHPITPYLGRTLRGVVEHTWVRGHQVLRHGSIVGEPSGRPRLRRGR